MKYKLHVQRVELANKIKGIEHHKKIRLYYQLQQSKLKKLKSVPTTRPILMIEPVHLTPDLNETSLLQYLSDRLPNYMLGFQMMFVKKLPRLNNGKLDMQKLKLIAVNNITKDCSINKSTNLDNPLEKLLLTIFRKILNNQSIGSEDNFFQFGGDSISSIQLLSLLRSEGYEIRPTDTFNFPTVAQLLERLRPIQIQNKNLKQTCQPLALTPIQKWFFSQQFIHPQQWNLARVYQLDKKINSSHVRSIWPYLIKSYDVLSLHIIKDNDDYLQNFDSSDHDCPLKVHDLSHINLEQAEIEFTKIVEHSQSNFDLTKSPLLQLDYFYLPGISSPRLVICAHHLIIDNVSWWLLIEKINTLLNAIVNNMPISNIENDNYYQYWSQRLNELKNRSDIDRIKKLWSKQLSQNEPLLLYDSAENVEESSSLTQNVKLDKPQTLKLLKRCNRAYNTHVVHLLLTAFAFTLKDCLPKKRLCVNLEHNGRTIEQFDQPISETLGWFTVNYPMPLSVDDNENMENDMLIGHNIKKIKELEKSLQKEALTYDFIRDKLTKTNQLNVEFPEPEILFNYMGMVDYEPKNPLLKQLNIEVSRQRHPKNKRTHLIEINIQTREDQLNIKVRYSSNVIKSKNIVQLSNSFVTHIKRIINHCSAVEKKFYTPSDFPFAGLNQGELDALISSRQSIHKEIENIHPLTHTQQAIVLNSLKTPQIDGRICVNAILDGSIESSLIKESWQWVINRHAMLRTAIDLNVDSLPLLIVYKTIEAQIKFINEEQAKLIERGVTVEILAKERLSSPNQNALFIFCEDEKTHRLYWLCRDVFLDGFSTRIVLGELITYYNENLLGHDRLTQSPPEYISYVTWLNNHSISKIKTAWKRSFESRFPVARRQLNRHFTFYKQSLTLKESELGRLKNSATTHKSTMNIIIQRIWVVIISALTKNLNVQYSITTNGRNINLGDVEKMVGVFANILPINIKLSAQNNVESLIDELIEINNKLNEFSYLSPLLLQRWGFMPSQHRFNSLVVIERFIEFEQADDYQLKLKNINSPIVSAFPLTLVAKPDTGVFTLQYDQSIISCELAAQILQAIETLINLENVNQHELGKLIQRFAKHFHENGFRLPNKEIIKKANGNSYPCTAVELKIRKIWHQVLSNFYIDEICLEDNFFNLGGSSLQAISMIEQIHKFLNIQIPIVEFFKNPSIQGLSEFVQNNKHYRYSKLVAIKPTGKQAPFFLIDGGNRGTMILANELNEDRPLYFLEADWDQADINCYVKIEQLARDYLTLIKTIQPAGPYYLGGYSFGAIIVYELAQQLLKNNEKINFLFLLDPLNTSDHFKQVNVTNQLSPILNTTSIDLELVDKLDFSIKPSKYANFKLSIKNTLLMFKRHALFNMSKCYRRLDKPIPIKWRNDYVSVVYTKAVNRYHIHPIDSIFLLFCNENRDIDLWQSLAKKGIYLENFQASHRQFMNAPMIVSRWAIMLNEYLMKSDELDNDID